MSRSDRQSQPGYGIDSFQGRQRAASRTAAPHDSPAHDHHSGHNCADGHDHNHDHDHCHDHAHDHDHGPSVFGHSHFSHADSAAKLATSLGMACIILAAEIVGGLTSHSLALLSDAGHMITDVAALGLAWYAQRQAGRPATHSHTYGFHRAGIMAALFNAVVLIVLSGIIVWEALERLRSPVQHLSAPIMFGVATVALVVNLLIARMLGHVHTDNLNVRSALLHVLGDAAASAGVIVGGIVIAIQPRWTFIDSLLSVGIALIILVGAWQVVAAALNVLMEGTPAGVDRREIQESLEGIPGVLQVHHLHVWTLSPGLNALSGHVVIEDQALSETEGILTEIHTVLRSRHGVNHATIQFEHRDCGAVCTLCREDTTAGAQPVS